jgi:dephospho-CoA kinase
MKNEIGKVSCGNDIRVIGLTGGTGSGKSEAARRFEELGFPIINADTIGHEFLLPGNQAEKEIIEAFGPDIVTDDRIDRNKLGALVFSDLKARTKLNGIVHPQIKKEIKRRIEAFAEQGHKTVIIDAALIGESGKRDPCLDGLILVTCPAEVRVQRLVKARNITHGEALQRVRSQIPPETKLALADWVLDNRGALDDFLRSVEHLALELRAYES